MSAVALALTLGGAVIIRGALKGLGPADAFKDIFSRARGGEGLTSVSPPTGVIQPGQPTPYPPNVERWRGLVQAHFPPEHVNDALSIMECESRGNPNARHLGSGASGLFQHLPKYWSMRSQRAGVPGANIMDPVANVRVAAWLFKQSYSWDHWTCKRVLVKG